MGTAVVAPVSAIITLLLSGRLSPFEQDEYSPGQPRLTDTPAV
jgi:hypothetical protein